MVVFRFAAGDSTDPVDTRSFAVVIDGKDRSSLFQAAGETAWGPLASREESSSLSVGAHLVNARICSIRGTCTDVAVTVTVVASAMGPTVTTSSRTRALIGVLLGALKKLLPP